ncbi:MAG TPA: Wzz/FepE/Etk N-terminal domain-containing protein, partial [Paracoccaceae bacterium]|nr:Wzz/FepE/Etk N-terminal domain-containing protein [Paracoccaceae bacterium]
MSFGDDTDDRPGGGMNLDLRYWFWLFRRRFWLFALVAVTLSAAGLAVAFVLPPTYEARARLLVESQQIPSDLVRSTVNASAIEQIEVIKQRLLTRDTLLELAARHAVFSDADRMTPTQRADAMRRAIDFDQRVLGGRRSDTVSTAFSISFRSERPATAAGVVNDLDTRVLRQSAELRRNRAETTADYFRQEVERLSSELTEIEGRIVAFQEEHKSALPDSLAYRRSQLDSVQQRLQALEMERIELKQEREILRSAIGEGVVRPSVVGETQRELAELRRMMIRRSAILTEDHPEIRSLQRRIAAMERIAEAEAVVAESARASGETGPAEAVDPAMRELRRQLAVVEARLEFGAEVVADLEAERDRLARSLEETPNVQMELGVLTRTYRTLEA